MFLLLRHLQHHKRNTFKAYIQSSNQNEKKNKNVVVASSKRRSTSLSLIPIDIIIQMMNANQIKNGRRKKKRN